MNWQSEIDQHMRTINQPTAGPRRHSATAADQDEFVTPSEAAWKAYPVTRPQEDKKAAAEDEKEKHLWRVGDRLERGGFGQVTGELPTSLLSNVYGLLAFSLVFTFVGLLAGYGMDPGWVLLLFPAQICLIFAINVWREEQGLNLVLLYTFCAATGLMLGPAISEVVGAGMLDLVIQAAAATALITGSMFVIGRRIEQDLSAWGPFLFGALLAFLGIQVVNLLLFHTPIDQLLVCFGGVVLFSLYLIFDVNRIRYVPNTMGNAILICLDIYLDIINLFVNILQILIELAGEGD